jgi:hypothetical protein
MKRTHNPTDLSETSRSTCTEQSKGACAERSRSTCPERSRGALYYAMGGGLGHLSRTLSILRHMPDKPEPIRILTSSSLTPMVIPHSTFPVDFVASEIQRSRSAYYDYLVEYIRRYNISSIILDAFPWGIIGEWMDIGQGIPRYLIARQLKWNAYCDRVDHKKSAFPPETLIIEPIEDDYHSIIKNESSVAYLDEPIFYDADNSESHDKCLVIHTGDELEREILANFARVKMVEYDISEIDMIFPNHGIFPAERIISKYKYIVSGAGYNMAALSSQSAGKRRHFLLPFNRRFDNQHARVEHLKNGLWRDIKINGAVKAAGWIKSICKK